MIDPRPGDTLLFLGGDDLQLAAQCGAIVGLNGRTVVVDQNSGSAARIDAAGGKFGALLEHVSAAASSLPLDSDTFDVTTAPDISSWTADVCGARVAEALRVTRPAGRIVLISKAPAGLFGSKPKSTLTQEEVLAVLVAKGAVANRKIASVKGTEYYEGRKPRGQAW